MPTGLDCAASLGVGFFIMTGEESNGLLLVLGAILILMTAWRQYGAGDTVGSQGLEFLSADDDLKTVRMVSVATASENARGRFFYITGFLMLYITVVMVPQIGEAFVAIGRQDVSGGANAEINSWLSTNEAFLSRPVGFLFAVSVALGATAPAFAPIESRLRSLAYFLAGVPRNMYRVRRELEAFDYESIKNVPEETLTLSKAFENGHTKQAVANNATIQAISNALLCVDLLQRPIIGVHSYEFEHYFEDDKPKRRVEDLRARYARLRQRAGNEKFDDTSLEVLLHDAQSLLKTLQSYFALFVVRKGNVPAYLRDEPEAQVFKEVIQNPSPQPLNNLLVTTVAAVVVGFFLSFATLWLFAGFNQWIVNSKYDAVSMTVETIPSYFPKSDLSGKVPQAEEKPRDSVGPDFERLRQYTIQVTRFAFMFLLFCPFVLTLVKLSRKDQGTWPEPNTDRPPIWDYFISAIGWTLFGVTLLLLIEVVSSSSVLNEFRQAGMREGIERIALFFKQEEQFAIWAAVRMFAVGVVFSIGFYYILDHHEEANMPMKKTVYRAGLGMAAIIGTSLFATLVFNIPGHLGFNWWQAAIVFALPFSVWLIAYSFVVEFFEPKQEGDAGGPGLGGKGE